MVLGLGSTLTSEIVLAVLIALVLFIIFKIGKFILKIIFGIIINSVVGIIAILALDYIFGLGIPIEIATMVPTALFGLPAVGTIIILKFLGVPI
ncbi:pro-sigmaK processing inhibitor BofA family protein [Candidatus Marsarchaeota archaeon]|nr:pro-sigmaK processing inhibitor BofA family protein [Candidatus Marsarchaeota archaeon]